LLVGINTSDDAGVYKLTDDLAIIQTVDFFTPIVDDPYMFGQIAAANSLSDVYAMGGTPKTVLNIVGFPIRNLAPSILADILKGASDKVNEAGAIIVGGHSIDDQEPKFGLSVTGIVHPDRIFRNIGALPGDALVLTKPIGVGILTSAIKRDALDESEIQQVSNVMAKLNKIAAENLSGYNVHAVTDITGFGLLGHAYEMASGSHVHFTIDFNAVPLLDQTKELAEKGIIPGGSKANHKWLKPHVDYQGLTDIEELILCDAVTSGGLLIAMPKKDASQYMLNMKAIGEFATIIGEVSEKRQKVISVVK
jgi:selenide, water dikinase